MVLQNKCRTCLSSNKEMRYVHSSIRIVGVDVRLSDILLKYYSIKVTEDPVKYPENICINCVHQLTTTYSFQVLLQATSKKLQDRIDLPNSNSDQYDCGFEADEQTPVNEEKIMQKSKKSEKDEDMTRLFCVECKADFQSRKALRDHCNSKHPVKCDLGRDCEFCDEKFVDYQSLFLHMKLHSKPFVCEICWDGFYTDDDLNTHLCETVEGKSKSKTSLCQCDQCGKSYPYRYMRIHMLIHGDERGYSCKYCPKKFKVPCALNSHVIWNHKRTRNHKCEVCNAKFPTASARSAHVRKCHLKETKHKCGSCDRRYYSKSELNRHMLSHTGVKNYHCNICDKFYQTRNGLNFHLRSHSQVSSI